MCHYTTVSQLVVIMVQRIMSYFRSGELSLTILDVSSSFKTMNGQKDSTINSVQYFIMTGRKFSTTLLKGN